MESKTQTTPTTAAKPGANVSRKVRWLLAVTMTLESLLVFCLTLLDFDLVAATLTATIGSVTLLAISGIGVWAAWATWVQHDSWLGASLLGQFSILGLAGYTVLTDRRSPFPEFRVTGFACILGIIAFFWVFYLIAHRPGPLTAGSATIVALIPLLGFVQFWLQTDYLPRTSLPLVDVTTDLTPMGKTEDIVHLEAKVTINNRGSVPVYVGATVMRITAYPSGRPSGKPTELPDAIQFALNASTPYRADPLPIDQPKTLYANDLLPVGNTLAPGQSNTYRKVVDFDSHEWRLARLDVDGIFMTSPNVDEVYTCPAPPKDKKGKEVWFHDPDDPEHTPPERSRTEPIPRPQISADAEGFQDEIANPIYEKVADGVLKNFSAEKSASSREM